MKHGEKDAVHMERPSRFKNGVFISSLTLRASKASAGRRNFLGSEKTMAPEDKVPLRIRLGPGDGSLTQALNETCTHNMHEYINMILVDIKCLSLQNIL